MQEAESGSHVWQLPNPGLTVNPVQPNLHRALLEYWSVELQILIDQACIRDTIPNPSSREAWQDARKDLERLLSAQNCQSMLSFVATHTEC